MAPRNPTPEQIDHYSRLVMVTANFTGKGPSKRLEYRVGIRRHFTDHLWGVDLIGQGVQEPYSLWQAPGGETRLYNTSRPSMIDKSFKLVQEGKTSSLPYSGSTMGAKVDPTTGRKNTRKIPRSMCATVTAVSANSIRYPWWNQIETLQQTESEGIAMSNGTDRWISFAVPKLSRMRRHQESTVTASTTHGVTHGMVLDVDGDEPWDDINYQKPEPAVEPAAPVTVPVPDAPVTIPERVQIMREHFEWLTSNGMTVSIDNGELKVTL